MTGQAAVRAEAARLQAVFAASGATEVEVGLLLPADALLDLYGEDIRARAFVTDDPERGEMMLRPDFTVPIVQIHIASGAAPARYTYRGKVFRKQPAGSDRAPEYLQVGYERFDGDDAVAADAETFALFAKALQGVGLRPVTGDIGILRAAVETLSTTRARKAALRRHIWRPRRFRALLDRYTGRAPVDHARVALLDAVAARGADATIAEAGPEIGLRSTREIAERLANLAIDRAAPPISGAEAEALDALLRIRATLPDARARLRDVCADLPGLAPAVERFSARMTALDAAGIDVGALAFEASFGRTTLEYYDGFVFGFLAPRRPDLPPIATGGRYDALTRVLGGGAECPAVGGAIRPEALVQVAEGAE